MKFLSPESALYLYESTICPCMEYCCHVGAGAPNCYLELLDKLQKWICRTCCFSWTIGSLSKCVQLRFFQLKFFFNFFYRYYLVDVLQNCLDWFHFLFFRGRSTRYSDRLHDFSVTIPRCYKNVYVNNFFRTARLWNSLPIKCFLLTYDINGFKSRIKRHLLTVDSFWRDFLYALIFLCFFFL